jgi:hypothetical protein
VRGKRGAGWASGQAVGTGWREPLRLGAAGLEGSKGGASGARRAGRGSRGTAGGAASGALRIKAGMSRGAPMWGTARQGDTAARPARASALGAQAPAQGAERGERDGRAGWAPRARWYLGASEARFGKGWSAVGENAGRHAGQLNSRPSGAARAGRAGRAGITGGRRRGEASLRARRPLAGGAGEPGHENRLAALGWARGSGRAGGAADSAGGGAVLQ